MRIAGPDVVGYWLYKEFRREVKHCGSSLGFVLLIWHYWYKDVRLHRNDILYVIAINIYPPWMITVSSFAFFACAKSLIYNTYRNPTLSYRLIDSSYIMLMLLKLFYSMFLQTNLIGKINLIGVFHVQLFERFNRADIIRSKFKYT